MSRGTTVEELEIEALAFLEANAARRAERRFEWGQGPDRVSLVSERTPEADRRELAAARAWSRKVFDAGFGWLTGPPAYSGRGLTDAHARRWRQLEARYDTPSQAVFGIGRGMVAPTVLAHGTEEAKQRYLRAVHRGDVVACQLFSEPGAGSDLAGVQARAVRDGDGWVVDGQKVWTSYAHLADVGEILCRTDPRAERHRGLTAFLVDMRAPGVEVRPLRQMTGGSSFNEVFLTEVRIPDDHRLGEVGGGWSVALTTLMNERAAIGTGDAGGAGGNRGEERLVALVRHSGRAGDPLVRQQLARAVADGRVARYTGMRAMAGMADGRAPGPELSITKLALTRSVLSVCDLVSSVLGPELAADSGRWGTYAWTELVLGAPAIRIAGGTDEVLRNVVGERVLGLPKEPAPDR